MKTYWNRRDLLKGTGVAIGLLAMARSMRSFAAPTIGPKRLVVFWTPNGRVQEDFWPTGGGTNFSLNAGMAALEPHKSDLTILKGITFAGTGDHKTGQPFSTSAFPSDNAGPSIDQEIGAAIDQSPLVLCGQSKNENRRGFVSFDRSGAWVTPVRSPQAAFEGVFGPITPGPQPSGPTGRDAELEDRILATAIADLESVKTRVPSREISKLNDHLDALMELRAKITNDPILVSCDRDGTPFAGDLDYQTRVERHIELMAMSIACDARRVFSFMMAPAGHDATNWGFLGVSGGDIHNDIAHSSVDSADAKEKMRTVGLWEVDRLARLVELLKATPEGEGTAFDNTVILWTTECTHGNHGHWDIPVVLLGSAGGRLKTGRYLSGAAAPKYENVLMSLAAAFDHPLQTFGQSGTGGPSSDLLA